MEGLKRGGKVIKKRRVVRKRTTKTVTQVAKGKKIAQFKGTGAQVIVNVPNPKSQARQLLNESQARGLSSILPSVMAAQMQSQTRMEQLMDSRFRNEQHIGHAEAVRASAVAAGSQLAAEDAGIRLSGLAAENRRVAAQQRRLQEQVAELPMVEETRSLLGTPHPTPASTPLPSSGTAHWSEMGERSGETRAHTEQSSSAGRPSHFGLTREQRRLYDIGQARPIPSSRRPSSRSSSSRSGSEASAPSTPHVMLSSPSGTEWEKRQHAREKETLAGKGRRMYLVPFKPKLGPYQGKRREGESLADWRERTGAKATRWSSIEKFREQAKTIKIKK